jgi:FMN reductase
MSLVVVSAGESATSRTRALADRALALGGGGRLIDLADLSADGLLGRRPDAEVDDAVQAAAAASVLVLASPIYRATVSGAMKAFLDRFPTAGLSGTAVVLVATAAAPQHYLALDTSGRALVASLDGCTVPTVVYAISADVVDGRPSAELDARLARALAEGAQLAEGLARAAPLPGPPS